MLTFSLLQERDNMQKSEFLKALLDMWKDFDARVLRYKVGIMDFGIIFISLYRGLKQETSASL